MKCIFQEGIGTTEGKDRWLFPEEINENQVLNKVQIAFYKNRSCYYTTHFTSNNKSYYPFLFIDLDSVDLEKSLKSAQSIIGFFLSIGVRNDNLMIAFSGNKGFHILLDTRCIFTDVPTKEIFSHFFQRTFVTLIHKQLKEDVILPDLKIYSKTRKIRALYSKHNSSGLYKIPLTVDELNSLTIEQIKERAMQPSVIPPAQTDTSLSFFISPVNFNEQLSKLFAKAVEETDIKKVKDKKKKIKKDQTSKNKKIGLSSTAVTALACRAIRQKTHYIIQDKTASGQTRRNLASALYGTDNRKNFILKVLSNDRSFNKSITEAKLEGFSTVSSCDNLIADGFCTLKCSKYLKKDETEANTPIYFGENLNGKWNQITTPNNISQVAFRLRKYHQTTTDFFDWANCDQFLQNSEIFSYAISDYLKKGKIPSFKNYVVYVRKDKVKYRSLSYVHFEYELLLGLFTDEGLKSNKKFKNEYVKSEIVFSYGYQDPDGQKKSLIRAWQDEYKDYKETLEKMASSQEWSIVYSDDVIDFYPSIDLAGLITKSVYM